MSVHLYTRNSSPKNVVIIMGMFESYLNLGRAVQKGVILMMQNIVIDRV